MVILPRGETFVKAIDSIGSIESCSFIANMVFLCGRGSGFQKFSQDYYGQCKELKGSRTNFKEAAPPCLSLLERILNSLHLVLKDVYSSGDTTNSLKKLLKFLIKM